MANIRFQDILDRNLKVMKEMEKKGKKEYDKYSRDFEKSQSLLENENNFINFNFNLNKSGSRRNLLISGVPVAIASLVTAVGIVGIILPSIPLIMAHGEVGLTDAHRVVISKLEDFISKAGSLSLSGLKSMGISLIAPALYGAIAVPKTLLDDIKLEKGIEAENMIPFLDDLLVMLEDLRVGKEDISLNFIKEFLSHVDISKNKPEFNLELLYRLSEYRTSVLRENDGVDRKGETSKSFMAIIEYLKNADIENGASKRFLSSKYVTNLLDTYAPINDEKRDMTRFRR